jgi:hypothetical protein
LPRRGRYDERFCSHFLRGLNKPFDSECDRCQRSRKIDKAVIPSGFGHEESAGCPGPPDARRRAHPSGVFLLEARSLHGTSRFFSATALRNDRIGLGRWWGAPEIRHFGLSGAGGGANGFQLGSHTRQCRKNNQAVIPSGLSHEESAGRLGPADARRRAHPVGVFLSEAHSLHGTSRFLSGAALRNDRIVLGKIGFRLRSALDGWRYRG